MGIYQFLANRGLHPDAADISSWPHPGLNQDSVEIATTANYISLNRALEAYCNDEGSLRSVATDNGIHPTTLSRALERCFSVDPAGNFVGRAGLVRYKHLNPYQRSTSCESNWSGAFSQLLVRTGIEEELRLLIRGKHPRFGPVVAPIDIHECFMALLEESGADKSRYPYTVKNLGKQALSSFVKLVRVERPLESIRLLYGPKAARKIGRQMTHTGDLRTYLEPYEWVEVDAHKLDGIIILDLMGLDGVPVSIPLERLWIIVVLEGKSKNVLGWSLGFGRNPTKDNVAEALTRSIVPFQKTRLTIPGLEYSARGGYPSTDVDGCAYRLPDVIHFDNDKAHWARALQQELCTKGGAIIHLGRGEQPDDRPNVENLFDTLEKQFLHQFRTTTGSSPQDPQRDEPEVAAVKYRFDYDVLRQGLEAWFYDKNGVPPPGAPRSAPIIHLGRAIAASDALARCVPPDERTDWSLHDEWLVRQVRGGGKDQSPPYVTVNKAKYRSERLMNRWDLIGDSVRLKIYPPNSMRIDMYLLDGTYFDTLLVEKRWRVPHSFAARALYNRISKSNEHEPRSGIARVVFRHLLSRARRSKLEANRLQRIIVEEPLLLKEFLNETSGDEFRAEDTLPATAYNDPRMETIDVPQLGF